MERTIKETIKNLQDARKELTKAITTGLIEPTNLEHDENHSYGYVIKLTYMVEDLGRINLSIHKDGYFCDHSSLLTRDDSKKEKEFCDRYIKMFSKMEIEALKRRLEELEK